MKAYSTLKRTSSPRFSTTFQFFLEYNLTVSSKFLNTFVFLVKVSYFTRFATNCPHFTTIDTINTNLAYVCQQILGIKLLETRKLLLLLSMRVKCSTCLGKGWWSLLGNGEVGFLHRTRERMGWRMVSWIPCPFNYWSKSTYFTITRQLSISVRGGTRWQISESQRG